MELRHNIGISASCKHAQFGVVSDHEPLVFDDLVLAANIVVAATGCCQHSLGLAAKRSSFPCPTATTLSESAISRSGMEADLFRQEDGQG